MPSKKHVPAITEGPNILVVTLCSTRADRVDPTYQRNLTPNLNQLAAEGISFSRAYTNATTTLPAHASLLTGLLPDRHGVIDFETRLSTALPNLPGVLGLYGYRTAWVMESNLTGAGQAGAVAPAGLGRAQGFLDAFDDQLYVDDDGRGFDHLAAWLGANERPFFALALLRSAHLPYGDGQPYVEALHPDVEAWLNPPTFQGPSPTGLKETQRMKSFLKLIATEPEVSLSLNAAYDTGVANVDQALGRIIEALEKSGKRENTIIIVMGDHGEALGDAGRIGHSNNLNDAVIRVPLVWLDPALNLNGVTRNDDVSTIDIMPTLLQRVGATVPVGLDGRDLSETLNEQGNASRPIRSQAAGLSSKLQRRAVNERAGLDEVVSSGSLRILFTADGRLRAERRESEKVTPVSEESEAVKALIGWKKSADLHRTRGTADRVTLSPEVIQQLQAEGYW